MYRTYNDTSVQSCTGRAVNTLVVVGLGIDKDSICSVLRANLMRGVLGDPYIQIIRSNLQIVTVEPVCDEPTRRGQIYRNPHPVLIEG